MLGLIWAEDSNKAIGGDNTLLWHIPEDLAFFKEVTLGATVLMGRNTWDSLPERAKPLPGRRNIVVSRTVLELPGAEVYPSISEALKSVQANEDVWCIGGGQLYEQLIMVADKIYVTKVDIEVDNADTYAPTIDNFDFVISESTDNVLSKTGLNFFHIKYESYTTPIS